MSLAIQSRILNWDGCFNVRDLGGLPTRDGDAVKWGALVRSDLPSRLTETGRKSLVEHGVRTIVDLRFSRELEGAGEAYPFFGSSSGVGIAHVPFDTGRDPGKSASLLEAYHDAQTRSELNRIDLDWSQPGIVAAVATISDAPDGGVLVHCHAGKDRTGIVIALILAVIGVDDDLVAEDYAMTSLNLEPLIADWLDRNSDDPVERARLTTLANPAKEVMLDTLAYLSSRYGSAEDYLTVGGLSEAQSVRLRRRLLAGN